MMYKEHKKGFTGSVVHKKGLRYFFQQTSDNISVPR